MSLKERSAIDLEIVFNISLIILPRDKLENDENKRFILMKQVVNFIDLQESERDLTIQKNVCEKKCISRSKK